ncbi:MULTISPECIES: YdgA family protein [Tatumella]|uniref:YdgA family protein n=1 Tax=Tatumella punctata TaxID=399969 RepID=A0ABW1VI81_9GAMM|nr:MULTISPECIES: YdgA family protein [unclassified Tatumella]MBS0855067.1 YdgA family protein [Tatumella sp. JGM16]MBS0892683.1 YdgA family protein [Tatumella sp. JGM130]MBS0911962.1 YdgA family protein [Tatumella sp. JGM91]
MKKTNVALGVVIALGVVWTGASWFTGKKTESDIDQLITRANQQIATNFPDSHLQLTKQNYQRGVFSSHLQLVLQSSAGATDSSFLPPGKQIILNETIDHGPFPLSQLKRFNLIPAAASVHSELVSNDQLKGLFSLSGGQSPVTADTRLSYTMATDTRINVLPLQYADDSGKATSQASVFDIAADSQQNHISFSAEIGDLLLSFKNDSKLPVNIALSGLNLSGTSYLSDEGLRLGSQKLSLSSLETKVDSQPALAIKGADLNSHFNDKQGKTGGKINYTIDDLSLRQQSLGSAALSITLSNFDTRSVKQFYDNYNQVVQENLSAIAAGSQQDPQEMQQSVNAAVLQNLPLLLKGAPVVSIDSLSLKNNRGESHFSLQADFNDPAANTVAPQSLSQLTDRYMKNLNASLSINMPMAQQLVTVLGETQGYTAAAAQQSAEQQIKGLAAMGEMFRLTKVKDQDIVTELHYGQGDVTINGDNIPLEQFIQQYVPLLQGDGQQ